MEAALELVGEGPGAALDAGMGPGRLLSELALRGWDVSGVDASEEMVEVARRRIPEAASRLVQSLIESLPFPEGSFDVVIATGVLEYSELERSLPELLRVLRSGGRAVVSYPNPANLYGKWKTRVWYRVVNAAKRLGGRPALSFPQGSGAVGPRAFEDLLVAAGLHPERRVFTSYLAVPSPLDELLPGLDERIGRRLEGRGARVRNRFGSQVVFEARKL